MRDRFADLLRNMEEAVLRGPGVTPPELRQSAAAGREMPAEIAAFVSKVHNHAYKITDEEVAALAAAGYSDDQLFEITVSAAVGASLERLRAGLRALEEDDEDQER